MEDVKESREMVKRANLHSLNAFVLSLRIHLVTINFICVYLLLKVFETV